MSSASSAVKLKLDSIDFVPNVKKKFKIKTPKPRNKYEFQLMERPSDSTTGCTSSHSHSFFHTQTVQPAMPLIGKDSTEQWFSPMATFDTPQKFLKS